MVFCNIWKEYQNTKWNQVTILILVDGFLQYDNWIEYQPAAAGHNPYFSRWFSAI